MKENIRYDLIENYTMKCRLYPNKTAAACIDRIIHAVQVAYNNATYEMYTNYTNTKERVWKNGRIVHDVDYKALISKEYLDHLRSLDPNLRFVPGGALSGKNGLFLADHKKAMCHKEIVVTRKDGTQKRAHEKKARTSKKGALLPYSIEEANIDFYSKSNPRTSYTYQATMGNNVRLSENKNVFYLSLVHVEDANSEKIPIKVRGWNRNIRFGTDRKLDFLGYICAVDRLVTITVSKDNCGDYWICFNLQNVWKPMCAASGNTTGVDVGIKDIAILEDGTKYRNMHFKELEFNHKKTIDRQLSRRSGWRNKAFRDARKLDKTLKPSKRYLSAQQSLSRLERKIARKRQHYNHCITRDIIEKYGGIGVETLNVSGMFRNRHLSKALADAAMGSVLMMIKYKGEWHRRDIRAINRWTPSSKQCSCCGYVMPEMPLSVRKWTCPNCGVEHDRDQNSAACIHKYAFDLW